MSAASSSESCDRTDSRPRAKALYAKSVSRNFGLECDDPSFINATISKSLAGGSLACGIGRIEQFDSQHPASPSATIGHPHFLQRGSLACGSEGAALYAA